MNSAIADFVGNKVIGIYFAGSASGVLSLS
jgi:hypothetical protein